VHGGHSSGPADPVDLWLFENEQAPGRSISPGRDPLVPAETVLGVLFLLWGTILLMLFAFDLMIGGFLSVFLPGIRSWWLASLALSAVGGWIAFELSNAEGFDVTREPGPSPG
jgi:hypothetical protein